MVLEAVFAQLPIIITSVKIWCILYGTFRLSTDVFFSIFPTSVLGILIIYGLLYYFRLEPVHPAVVTKVLGVDTLKTDKSLPFQTTSRLFQLTASGSNFTSSNSQLTPNDNGGSGIPNDYCMQIVGHRGAGLDSPENTLISFRNCKLRGCTAVEFDVGITKDGIPVLFHDDNLSRMTGVNKLLGDVTWNELKNLELFHPLRSRYSAERVPTFQEGIETCLELDLRFFIDIKDSGATEHILHAYKKYPQMYDRAIVTSFDIRIIYILRKVDPNIVGCCAWRPGFFRYETWNGELQNLEKRNTLFIKDWLSVIADWMHLWLVTNVAWWFVGLSVVLLNKDGLRRDDLSRWSKKGIRVLSWTVNNPVEKLHTIQNYRIGYLTDTLDMPKPPSSVGFLTPVQKSEDKLSSNGTTKSVQPPK